MKNRFAKAFFATIAFSGIFLNATEPATKTVPAEDAATKAIEDFNNTIETRTAFFSIFAKDVYSARRTARIAEKLEGHVETLLTWKNFTGDVALSVTLNEEKSAPSCEFGRDSRGNVACTIFGQIDTLSDFALASILANSLVSQYAMANGIDVPGEAAPLWLVSALATEAEITREGGRYLMLRERSLSEKPIPFLDIFERKFDGNAADERFRQNAFWFYRFLRKQKIFLSKNYEETVLEVLKNPQVLNPKKLSDSAMDLRWATAFFSTVEKSPAGTENLVASRERFSRLKIFTVSVDGKDRPLHAKMLIALRNSPDIKKLSYERANEILNEISTTNPAWFNAFLELGTFFEMIAQPEPDEKIRREGTLWTPARGTQKELRENALSKQWGKTEAARTDAETLSKEIRALIEKDFASRDAKAHESSAGTL